MPKVTQLGNSKLDLNPGRLTMTPHKDILMAAKSVLFSLESAHEDKTIWKTAYADHSVLFLLNLNIVVIHLSFVSNPISVRIQTH